MLAAGERPPRIASRIKGRGALVRSLRSLVLRVHRFGEHRAATDDERRWTARLHDQLTGALRDTLTSEAARASLRAYDERRRISRKGRSVTPPPIGFESGHP